MMTHPEVPSFRIVVVAINPAGTLGHLTSVIAASEAVSRCAGAHVTVVADAEIASRLRVGNIVSVQRCRPERSDGGALSRSYDSNLRDLIMGLRPDAVIFDTFFSVDVLYALQDVAVPRYVISYRFRDTTLEIFRQRWQHYFTRVFWLCEPYELHTGAPLGIGPLEKEQQLPPLAWPAAQSSECDDNRVLITRGGGGQSGTEAAFERVLDCLSGSDQFSPVVVSGPFGRKLERSGGCSRVCKQLRRTEFLDLLGSSCLVVSEAGYNTCFELACLGRRALLIPGPRRTDNQELRAVRMSTLPGFSYVLPEHRDKITEAFIQERISRGEVIHRIEAPNVLGTQLLCAALEQDKQK